MLGFGAKLSGRLHHRRHKRRVAKANLMYNTNVLNHTPNKFGSRFGLKPHGQKRMQTEGETREKTRKRSKDCCDPDEVNAISNTVSSRNSGVIFHLNEDVTIEILSRLPVKSLLRFKCVCKNWFHLIQKDTSFINLHFERSKARPCLLVTNQIKYQNQKKYNLMTFDLLFGGSARGVSGSTFNTIQEIYFSKYAMILLKPVNGLIGFFSKYDGGVCICNPSTREVTPWIESKLFDETKRTNKWYRIPNATCTLGYDPATNEYKVVCIWSTGPSCTVCEVLTVGDNEWRQIDEVPPYNLEVHGSNVYINGSIYYSTLAVGNANNDKERPMIIVAFDVGSEKFRTIMVPNDVFHQPGYDVTFFTYDIELLELGRRLGLLIKPRYINDIPKLWLFDDDDRNKKHSTSSWNQVTMELPAYSLDEDYSEFRITPIPGTNQIILSFYVRTSDWDICNTPYRSYDWKTKSFNEIGFNGIPSSVPFFTSVSSVATFFEHLLPVRKQNSFEHLLPV